MNELVCGWGVNDAGYAIQSRTSTMVGGVRRRVVEFDCPYYRRWSHMLMRCHNAKFRARNPAYAKATICDEWKSFADFKAWMERQPWQGNELDKDILGDGSLYSPGTCCFVPKSVNMFWTRCTSKDGGLIGVSFVKSRGNYVAQCSNGGHRKALGVFSSAIDAHKAWIRAKGQALDDLLNPLSLDERIVKGMYDKLMAFEIAADELTKGPRP